MGMAEEAWALIEVKGYGMPYEVIDPEEVKTAVEFDKFCQKSGRRVEC